MKHNLLFLDHAPVVGGAQTSLVQHMEAIDRDKFNVVVVSSTKAIDIGLTEKYDQAGIKHHEISFEKLKAFRLTVIANLFHTLFQLKSIVKKEKTDLIITMTVRASVISVFLNIFTGKKAVWLIRDFTFPKVIFFVLSFFPQKIIFNSKSINDYYIRYLWNKKKGGIVYVGKDFHKKLEKVSPDCVENIKKQYKLSSEDMVVGFAGRLVPRKGLQILIEAIRILRDKGCKNIKCIIVGTGRGQDMDNENELKNQVKAAGLGDSVFFTGFQSDVAPFYKIFDIVALTSIEPEPFASMVVEAMMARSAVIGTDIGGTPEIVKDNEAGLLVKPADPAGLAKAILRLINDPELRKKMTGNAYRYVMEHNTVEKITKELEDVYSHILNN